MADKLFSMEDLTALGSAIGAALNQGGVPVRKEASITPPATSIYGRNTIFDPCTPGDIFGLQVQVAGLMQWLGFRKNTKYSRRVDFITYWAASGASEGRSSAGYGSPCSDPNGWEYGQCGYELTHSSWYQRASDGLDPHTIVQDRCETTPRYRLNGMQITDDVEWQMNGILNVLKQDISRDIIHGTHINSYQMNGLESVIKTGYTDREGRVCTGVDSVLVDWNNDTLDGETNQLGNFFTYLDELVTEIEYRSSVIGTIATQDMVLLTSRFMATALLDSYACYTVCGITDQGSISDVGLRSQALQYRLTLNGGALYDGTTAVGYITLKSGRRLPILVDDFIDISQDSGNYVSDIYLLTRRIGSQEVLYGEYLDTNVYSNKVNGAFNSTIRSDAAGRFVTKGKEDNWCIQVLVGTSPEIYLAAPWAQARISDVAVARSRKPVTGDPHQPTYMFTAMYPAASLGA